MTEMEYQIYNWYDFNWLSATCRALNLVHNVDKAAWAMHDEPPREGLGHGRPGSPQGPNVWRRLRPSRHRVRVRQWRADVRLLPADQWRLTEISDKFVGTKGRCDLLKYIIEGETNWRYEGPASSRFDLEHVALFSAIRSAKPINNGVYMARSSLLALMFDLVLPYGSRDHLGAGLELEDAGQPAAIRLRRRPANHARLRRQLLHRRAGSHEAS